MDKDKFLELLSEVLEVDRIEENAVLEEYAWDSLAVLTLISQVDAASGKVLKPELVNKAKTPSDLFQVFEES